METNQIKNNKNKEIIKLDSNQWKAIDKQWRESLSNISDQNLERNTIVLSKKVKQSIWLIQDLKNSFAVTKDFIIIQSSKNNVQIISRENQNIIRDWKLEFNYVLNEAKSLFKLLDYEGNYLVFQQNANILDYYKIEIINNEIKCNWVSSFKTTKINNFIVDQVNKIVCIQTEEQCIINKLLIEENSFSLLDNAYRINQEQNAKIIFITNQLNSYILFYNNQGQLFLAEKDSQTKQVIINNKEHIKMLNKCQSVKLIQIEYKNFYFIACNYHGEINLYKINEENKLSLISAVYFQDLICIPDQIDIQDYQIDIILLNLKGQQQSICLYDNWFRILVILEINNCKFNLRKVYSYQKAFNSIYFHQDQIYFSLIENDCINQYNIYNINNVDTIIKKETLNEYWGMLIDWIILFQELEQIKQENYQQEEQEEIQQVNDSQQIQELQYSVQPIDYKYFLSKNSLSNIKQKNLFNLNCYFIQSKTQQDQSNICLQEFWLQKNQNLIQILQKINEFMLKNPNKLNVELQDKIQLFLTKNEQQKNKIIYLKLTQLLNYLKTKKTFHIKKVQEILNTNNKGKFSIQEFKVLATKKTSNNSNNKQIKTLSKKQFIQFQTKSKSKNFITISKLEFQQQEEVFIKKSQQMIQDSLQEMQNKIDNKLKDQEKQIVSKMSKIFENNEPSTDIEETDLTIENFNKEIQRKLEQEFQRVKVLSQKHEEKPLQNISKIFQDSIFHQSEYFNLITKLIHKGVKAMSVDIHSFESESRITKLKKIENGIQNCQEKLLQINDPKMQSKTEEIPWSLNDSVFLNRISGNLSLSKFNV